MAGEASRALRQRNPRSIRGRGPLLGAVLVVVAALSGFVPVHAQDAGTRQARDIDEGCPPGEVDESGFSDRDAMSSEVRAAVDCTVHFRIAQGKPDGTYAPDEAVRRDQMATFVARSLLAAGERRPPADELDDAFADDDPCAPDDAACRDEGGHTTPAHEHNINWLADLGIVAGDGHGAYDATRPVRRDQMASFVNRVIQHLTGAGVGAGRDYFAGENCPDVHDPHVDGLASVGIVQGAGDGTYDCAAAVSRGQMALFLARSIDYLVEEETVAFSPPPAVRLTLTTTTLVRGGETTGTVTADDGEVTRLVVDGCGLEDRPLPVSDRGVFRVRLPDTQAAGGCRLVFGIETQDADRS